MTTPTENNETLVWHFLAADCHTRYQPRVLVTPGSTLKHDGRLALCESGLRASVRAIDALRYAPGPVVCRVKLGGEIKHEEGKCVARECTVLWMYDATNVLHEMACLSAESALLIANVEDERSWQAIEAKRAWLRGEISGGELAAASTAAVAAASAAARTACAYTNATSRSASAAARAAWASTWAGAGISASTAAVAAASAASGAPWAAAWDEQNTVLEALLTEEARRRGLTP